MKSVSDFLSYIANAVNSNNFDFNDCNLLEDESIEHLWQINIQKEMS